MARRKLWNLLGSFPSCRFNLEIRKRLPSRLADTRIEQLQLRSPIGQPIRAILTGPEGEWRRLPAVLYCHAHGNRYGIGASELIEGRPALLPEPYGQALAREGVVALSIDMPCFGERAGDTEQALAKAMLFQGRTLFGQMLAELGGARALLAQIDGVDPARIGVFGFSMGATLAFWLGALEPEIKAIAHACAFADLRMLVSTGAHDLHGIYMAVPGLLEHFTTGEIAALAAPRPQLACVGLLDPLTPRDAVDRAMADVSLGYSILQASALFQSLIGIDTGHIETGVMRREITLFFSRQL
jgi:cephalosporin-C deacetylase-like acetyl esterase